MPPMYKRARNNTAATYLRLLSVLATTALTPLNTAFAGGEVFDASPMWWANAVSGNGQHVVGTRLTDDGDFRAIIYSNGTHTDIEGLFDGPYNDTRAYGVSNNGMVTGEARNVGGNYNAFRWSASRGTENLGTLTGTTGVNEMSVGLGISDDGTRVVGYSSKAGSGQYAFAWLEGATTGNAGNRQMFELGGLGGNSYANAIAGDGKYAVGAAMAGGGYRAVRWNLTSIENDGTAVALEIGALAVGAYSSASAISADGRIVVGSSGYDGNSAHTHAYRWVDGEGMHDLGTLMGAADYRSHATGVSADGSIVIGTSEVENDGPFMQAFIWKEETGMVYLGDWLTSNGIAIGDRWFGDATSISDDGTVVVGMMEDVEGDDQRAYIARVLPNGGQSGLMDVDEYNHTLGLVANLADLGMYQNSINGAHHRPLMDYAITGSNGACGWVTGDILRFNSDEDATTGLGEIGACADLFGGQMRAGIGFGMSHVSSGLPNGGDANTNSRYVVGEIDWRPSGSPLLVSILGLYGGADMDYRRAYTNGAAMTASLGDTDSRSGLMRVRADWKDALVFGSSGVSPYAAYTWSRRTVDGYTETEGTFPARYDEQSFTRNELRLGVSARTPLTDATALTGSAELVHSFGDAAKVSGEIIGVSAFSVGGGHDTETWARLGVDLDHKLTDSAMISVSAHAATDGYDPRLSGSVRLQYAF